jgi:hypothetical protein
MPSAGRASFDLPPIHTIPPSEADHEDTLSESNAPLPTLLVTRSASATHLPSTSPPITVVPPTPDPNGDSDSINTVRNSNDKDEESNMSRTKKAQRIIKEQIKEQVNKRQYQIQTFSKKLGRGNSLRSQMSRASSTPGKSLCPGGVDQVTHCYQIFLRC